MSNKPQITTFYTLESMRFHKISIMKAHLALLLTAFLFTWFVSSAFAQTTYTFATAGNWNVAANWGGGVVPPDPLPNSDFIVINANCTRSWYTTVNGTMTLNAGKKLQVHSVSEAIAKAFLKEK